MKSRTKTALQPYEPAASLPVVHPAVQQAANDSQVIALWLHGRSPHTQSAYQRDAGRFLAFAGKSLQQVTLADVQGFFDSLSNRARATQARSLAAVKSLLAFAHRIGYLPFNVGAAVRGPKLKDDLAERILPEDQLQTILALETHPRNRVLLRVLYASGARVSEICGLRWKDCQKRAPSPETPSQDAGGQITLFGKGDKTRAVLLPAATWKALVSIKGRAAPDDPVFKSRKGGALDPSQVLRIVRAAGERAGVAGVTPHWFRHCHASHALDRGCPISLVQATLGHSSVATTGRYLHVRPAASSSSFLPV